MNATDDDQPVGECPEYTLMAQPGRVEPIPALNMFHAIAAVRELHGDIDRDPDYPNIPPMCRQCFEYQPCSTNTALDKWGV